MRKKSMRRRSEKRKKNWEELNVKRKGENKGIIEGHRRESGQKGKRDPQKAEERGGERPYRR